MHAAFIFINFLFFNYSFISNSQMLQFADLFTQTAGLVGGFFHTTVNFFKKRSDVKTVTIECTKLFFFYTSKNFLNTLYYND